MKTKLVIFLVFLDIMRKDNSKQRKIEKHKKAHQPLSAFYTEEQRKQEHEKVQKEKHRKSVEDVEMEIFEHLKNHTKKVLKKA